MLVIPFQKWEPMHLAQLMLNGKTNIWAHRGIKHIVSRLRGHGDYWNDMVTACGDRMSMPS